MISAKNVPFFYKKWPKRVVVALLLFVVGCGSADRTDRQSPSTVWEDQADLSLDKSADESSAEESSSGMAKVNVALHLPEETGAFDKTVLLWKEESEPIFRRKELSPRLKGIHLLLTPEKRYVFGAEIWKIEPDARIVNQLVARSVIDKGTLCRHVASLLHAGENIVHVDLCPLKKDGSFAETLQPPPEKTTAHKQTKRRANATKTKGVRKLVRR